MFLRSYEWCKSCLVPTRHEHADFRPVFIVGHARSGTTLLAACLDRNTQIAVTPETHFFNQIALQLPPRLDSDLERWVHDLLKKTRLNDLKLDRGRLLQRLRYMEPTPATVFRGVLEEYAESRGKRVVVEKSPPHIMHLFTILQWYPHAKIVWIIRDGRDSLMSLLRMPWASNRLWVLSLQWRRNMAGAFAFAKAHPEVIYKVYYENLLHQPQSELMKLHDFLGVDFEPGQLDPHYHTEVVPRWETGWKEKATQGVDPTQAGTWRQKADKKQARLMNCLLGRYLRKLGYSDTSVTLCGLPATWLCTLIDAGLTILFQRYIYDTLYRPYLTFANMKARVKMHLDSKSPLSK